MTWSAVVVAWNEFLPRIGKFMLRALHLPRRREVHLLALHVLKEGGWNVARST